MADFPIIEYTTKTDGAVIPMVTMPQGSAVRVGIGFEAFKKDTYKRETLFKPEDLIAF